MSLPGVPTSMTLNDIGIRKIAVFSEFFAILGRTLKEIIVDKPRQPAHEI